MSDNSNKICVSKLSKFGKGKPVMTKIVGLDENGKFYKDGSQCKMSRGIITRHEVSPEKFMAGLSRLEQHQAIVLGTSEHDSAHVIWKGGLKKAQAKRRADAVPIIARSKEYLTADPDQAGAVLLDHDKPRDNAVGDDKALKPYTPDDLFDILCSIIPALCGCCYGVKSSSSACIFDKDGNEVRGKGAGYHIYLFIQDAADRERFLDVLGKRLFLAGYGRLEFSRAGAQLWRTLIDLLVASPERIIFEAPAICRDGLVQKAPEPEYHDGTLFDSHTVPDLTASEEKEYAHVKDELQAASEPTRLKIQDEYRKEESEKLATASGGRLTVEQACAAIEAKLMGYLADDDLLYFSHKNGEPVTVGVVLDNPGDYDGKNLADPLEPEYDGGSMSKAQFWANRKGGPVIHSFAHGGHEYQFARLQKPDVWNIDELEFYIPKVDFSDCIASDKSAFVNDIIKHCDQSDKIGWDVIRKLIKKHIGINMGSVDAAVKNERAESKEEKDDERTHSELSEAYGEDMLHSDPHSVATEGKIWNFDKGEGVFVSTDMDGLPNKIGAKYSGSYCKKGGDYKQISNLVYNKLLKKEFFSDAVYGVACKTKFHSVTSEGIKPVDYDPSLKQRFKLSVDPLENADAPLFAQYLEDSFKGDLLQEKCTLLQEILGGIITGCFSKLQKVVLLYGDGDNGKSVLLELLSSFFPRELQCAVNPGDFSSEYYKAQLAGKIVNVVGELDQAKALPTEFKDIAGCDNVITARLPYKEPFEFKPICCHIFASNHLPMTKDHTNGFYRRWAVLDFNNKVDAKKKIPNLGRLIAEKESPQVLAWALIGAKRLIDNNFALSLPPNHKELMEKWQTQKDSVFSFIYDDEVVVHSGKLTTPRVEFFNAYRDYCIDTGSRPVGRNHFFERCRVRLGEGKNSLGTRIFLDVGLAIKN